MQSPSITLAILAGLLSLTSISTANDQHKSRPLIDYTTVTGYFLQDELITNASTFNFQSTNFGLINQTYNSTGPCGLKNATQWQLFANQLEELNAQAPPRTAYKLLLLGRHGDGFHNDAEAYYGTPAWNCYYSIRDGNSTISWSDARLSPLGVSQALSVHDFWASQFRIQKQPAPQKFYTSPLTRCLQTANYTFNGLDLKSNSKQKSKDVGAFVPTVKELLREGISGHTCDRRSSKSEIHAAFPTYVFEDGFAETDGLWQALHGEPSFDQSYRSRLVLDEIFSHERKDVTYISITSHSGEIASILGVLKHRVFPLRTGAVIPVLVKAVTQGPSSTASPSPSQSQLQSFTPICTCTSPPAISATTSSTCAFPTGTDANGKIPVYPTPTAWY